MSLRWGPQDDRGNLTGLWIASQARNDNNTTLSLRGSPQDDRGNLTGLWIASHTLAMTMTTPPKNKKLKNKKSANYTVNTMCCAK